MTYLCELAEKYMTDRCPMHGHSYTPYYYELFKDRREDVRKLLEIGVGGSPDNRKHNPNYITGAGLYMWRDFFPRAMIYGVDIRPKLMFRAERIETFLCDQRDTEKMMLVLDATGTDLDIVIDDATHVPEDQINTALAILPRLQKGALYIIEDVSKVWIVDSLKDYNPQIVESWQKTKKDDRLVIMQV